MKKAFYLALVFMASTAHAKLDLKVVSRDQTWETTSAYTIANLAEQPTVDGYCIRGIVQTIAANKRNLDSRIYFTSGNGKLDLKINNPHEDVSLEENHLLEEPIEVAFQDKSYGDVQTECNRVTSTLIARIKNYKQYLKENGKVGQGVYAGLKKPKAAPALK